MKIFFTLVLLLSSAFSIHAQMPGWLNASPITITENSGTDVIDYQLNLTINTSDLVTAGLMLADGADIRFTSSCTGGINFPYWIESGMNTVSTSIWIKIDTLFANNSRTIYMQYNNPIGTSISAITGTFVGPHSSTDSVDNGAAGGVTDSQRGFRFYPNEDILVTSFGKREPNGTTRYITLFDNSTQAILQQMQVSGAAAQYSYADLSAPIWLTQGTQYILEMHQGSSDGYYFGSSSQIGEHLTYIDMRYCNGCNQNSFPNNYLNNYHYGYPDLWYYTKNNVNPAPTYVFGSFTTNLADMVSICLDDSASLDLTMSAGEEPFIFNWTGSNISNPGIQNPIANPSGTFEYFVTVTDNCGAQSLDSITVIVNPFPVVDIVADYPLICEGETAVLNIVGVDSYLWSTGETGNTISVQPSLTDTFTVTAVDANGCVNTDSIIITLNIPITATQIVTICEGEVYTINGNPYTVSAIYIDTLAGVTSCDSIITTELTVLPFPVLSQIVDLCFGTTYTIGQSTYSQEGVYIDTIPGMVFCDSIVTTTIVIQDEIDNDIQIVGLTLVADVGADSYQWFDCNGGSPILIPGETASTFEMTSNGSYFVAVGIGNCTNNSDCFTMNMIGIEEIDHVDNIQVYPNPNEGTFTIRSSSSQKIIVTDALGHIVGQYDVEGGKEFQINLDAISPGLYFVNSKTKVIRLVIE